MSKDVWYKTMEDAEIVNCLIDMSNDAIKLMKNGEKDQSLEKYRELKNKTQELREYVASFMGHYHGTPLYDFYRQIMIDTNVLLNDTMDRMMIAFDKLPYNNR